MFLQLWKAEQQALSQHTIPKRTMLSTKQNRSVNICGEKTQWDFWGLWMGRSANLTDNACSLWGTSPPDAEEGVETSCGKGDSPPSSPHFHPRCSALIYNNSTLLFWTEKTDERAEWAVQNMVWDWLWGPWYHMPSVSTFPGLVWWWFSNVVAQQHLCVALGGVTWVSASYMYATLVRNAGTAHSLVTGDSLQEEEEQALGATLFNVQCSWTLLSTWEKCLKWVC